MTTFLDILTNLKDRILTNINVFNNGYAYARLDDEIGLTVTVGNDAHYVGINDTEGDYFYIRVPEKISSSFTKPTYADCDVAISQRYPCTLVAVVKDADEFKLTDAICNELLKTKVIEVKAIWVDAIAIIDNEFKGLKPETLKKTKSKIGSRTIVRIDFEAIRIFNTNNCDYSICKPC